MFEFFYKRTHLLFATIIGMFIFGILGLVNMPKNLFPDSARPEVVVFTTMSGATANLIATSVSKPIEEEIAKLSNVYDIRSANVPNFSIIHIVFDYTKTLNNSMLDVSNALNKVKSKLPQNISSSIYLMGTFTQPVDIFSVSSDKLSLSEIRKIVDSFIKPRLLNSQDIGNVEVFGGYESAIMIQVNPDKLKKYNLNLSTVLKIISNENKNIPIGFVKSKNNFITLNYYGDSSNINKIKQLPISKNIILQDIAKVKWSSKTGNSGYIGNNIRSIAISVQRTPNGQVLKTSDSARKIIAQIKKDYPSLKITISDTQRQIVETSNNNMIEALRDAILYTLLVLLIFLGNFRAIFAAGLSIPLVFFGTITFIWLFIGEMNIIIYTGIILALGMLIDDAVVVLENIERHLEKNENLQDAIFHGTKEVLAPIFAGTFATGVILFPLIFVGGYPGKIFMPLIETILIALFVSYFISITFIPKLSSYLYRNGHNKTVVEQVFEKIYENTFGKFVAPYLSILHFSKNGIKYLRRVVLIIGAFIILGLSVKNIMPTIGKDTMPPMDTGIMKVSVEFSSNLNVDETINRLKPFTEWLKNQPWLEKSSIAIGTEIGILSLSGGGSGNSVMMNIIAVNRFKREKNLWELEKDVRDHLSNLQGVKKLSVIDYGATAVSTILSPLNIQLRSDNYEELPEKSHKVTNLLYKIKGLTTIKTSWDKDFEEIVLKIDKNKALSYGVTPLEIVSQIALKEQNIVISSNLSSLNSQPIKISFSDNFSKNIENLKLLLIDTKQGSVPLMQLATIKKDWTYNKIERDKLQYSIDIMAYRNRRPVTHLTDDSNKILKEAGINKYYQMGDIVSLNDSFGRVIKAIGIGIILLILTLTVIYKSLKLSLIMIMVLPLSMIGASWSLIIADKPSCMPSMVGILLLFGIIIKNAVLLIDFYQEKRETNSPFDSAVESIKLRFRPVMMTAFGTIAGMIPIALEQAIGLERLSPIADVAIGGLLIGTFLTLIYIPMLAYITDKKIAKTLY